ncbi:TetR/AcrR family transcriptional regulator [Catellatospora sichuanensis]|uniref:TetR/AcrR family transcriptional regulator n=1 Tax=Catellatospora sichuanensis TaxID=1969805 RepID=UPI0016431522|nr:TetR/AcrR family transcriptional regulator [Catellatospora sichuanensis]
MPRKVDHDQRRRHIVESLLRITGTQGLDAVSLREVAHEAGVSMGAVQHYFASKDEMLLFALQHWLSLSVHDRFAERVRDRLDREPAGEPAAVLRAIAAEYLPYDAASRAEVQVSIAFLSRAAVAPALATALAPAFAGFIHTLGAVFRNTGWAIDAPAEAQRLAALLDGLRLPVLVGALSHRDALTVVDRHLAQLPAGNAHV